MVQYEGTGVWVFTRWNSAVSLCFWRGYLYLNSVVQNNDLRRIRLAHGDVDSLSTSLSRSRYMCRRTDMQIFKSFVLPVLLDGWEILTINSVSKRWIDCLCNMRLYFVKPTITRWYWFKTYYPHSPSTPIPATRVCGNTIQKPTLPCSPGFYMTQPRLEDARGTLIEFVDRASWYILS